MSIDLSYTYSNNAFHEDPDLVNNCEGRPDYRHRNFLYFSKELHFHPRMWSPELSEVPWNKAACYLNSQISSNTKLNHKYHHLTNTLHLTLKLTTAQVVETSVTSNSLSKDYLHPDDHTRQTFDTPGFKPFTTKLNSSQTEGSRT